ncbi:MAG: YIP1 family protein [Candidatus Aenigmatarchaeota archaeon]
MYFSFLGVILILLISFIIGALYLHIFIKIFGGEGNFPSTMTAVAISSTPSFLLGWIPFVNIVGILYGIYIMLIGISILHKVSMGKALGIIVVATLVGIVIGAVIGIVFLPMILKKNYNITTLIA